MKTPINLFALSILVMSGLFLPGVARAWLPCHPISQGRFVDIYRVIFVCPSDERLLALDEWYPGCTELGTRERGDGTASTILNCEFLDRAEFKALEGAAFEKEKDIVLQAPGLNGIPEQKQPTLEQKQPTLEQKQPTLEQKQPTLEHKQQRTLEHK